MEGSFNYFRKIGNPNAYLYVWDSIMKDDALNLRQALGHYDHDQRTSWGGTLYGLITRFKKWKCLSVLCERLSVELLKHHYVREASLAYGDIPRGVIRMEMYRRGYVKVLLCRRLPEDLVTVLNNFLR